MSSMQELHNLWKQRDFVFDSEWHEIRVKQIEFLTQRPLLALLRTQEIWGPAALQNLWIAEMKELVDALERCSQPESMEELADMVLLLMTVDCIDTRLMVPAQVALLNSSFDIIQRYSLLLQLQSITAVLPAASMKQRSNELRNPPEAFQLKSGETVDAAERRLVHNWQMLKKHRPSLIGDPNWWMTALCLDADGWVRERK